MLDQKKLLKLASIIIGTVIAFVVLFIGFKLFSGGFTKAADTEPRDVVVANPSENSVKVTWSTGEDTQGVIEYGTTPTSLNFFSPEPAKTKNHTQDLTLLSPNTMYYFQIRIGDKKYDNGGVPWTFTTKNSEKSRVTTEPTVAPTAITIPTSQPVQPVQTLDVPIKPVLKCDVTECSAIKAKLGNGCSVQDYIRCLKK
jgi:hypothetical protein